MALTVTVEFGGGESPIGPPNGSPIRYKETTVYFISNPLEPHRKNVTPYGRMSFYIACSLPSALA